jgi:hypothetical protein
MLLLALYTMSNPRLIRRITGIRIMRLYPSYIFALSAIRKILYGGLENRAAVVVILEHVKAGAGGRQQHDVPFMGHGKAFATASTMFAAKVKGMTSVKASPEGLPPLP